MPNSFSLSSLATWARRGTWSKKITMLAILATAITAGVVISAPTLPPLVALSSEPLYMNGAKAKANLTLALSVEKTTVGATYRDTFDPVKKYVGYFDSLACYRSVLSSGDIGNYFDYAAARANTTIACPSSQFDGNFMNWATSSIIDIFRYGLSGGNRTTDEPGGNGRTVVERAWLPDDFYRNTAFFTEKFVPRDKFDGRTELALNKFPNGVWIYNCRNRVYFASAQDTTGGCTNPFGVANAGSSNLIAASNKAFYEVRNLICDPNTATNRLMSYDPDAKQWAGLCFRYPNGNYKPVGQLQMNAENLRVSVFSYLQDNSEVRYGGVMRSPLKYVGPKSFDQNFNLVAGTNPRAEWDGTTGVFIINPQSGDSTYGNQGYPFSGAINYINRFGTLTMDPTLTTRDDSRRDYQSSYKVNDPVSELYYEALRYLQGNKGPTSNAITGLTGVAATDKPLTENYPAYRTWDDPFAGFIDSTSSTGKGCLRNNIATIADVFTTYDRSVPGNPTTNTGDFSRGADTLPTLDVPAWTSVVGGFESGGAVSYTDSQGRAQTATNLSGNTTYSWLAAASTRTTGAGAGTTTATLTTEGNAGGSYHMAGLAYWANTQIFRSDIPKARVKTFAIDVNQNDASAQNVDFRRTRQLYLSAKYGGFDDSATDNSGNPYAPGTNVLWQGTDGDAKNYFLASDAQKFLDSLSELFARVVEETGSIAGGAISTQRLTSGQAAGVFQARFNPVANYWSGRLLKYPLSLSTDQNTLVIGSTPTWEAGDVLTKATKIDDGASRNIFIGPPIGTQTTIAPTEFKWSVLASAHQTELNTSISGIVDTLGSDRLNYLRGDRRKEISPSAPTNPFRPRDIVLGDIVNSGLVYQGRPSTSISGTEYQAFYTANKARAPVVFVNANDGMLHAFNDSDGKEAFAYIPGFLANKLSNLPDQDYSHISMADATPAVSEAYFDSDSKWHSVLVSGVGGGAQGVFALDVTDPSKFSENKVLWEFTERDHPAMGNVIGSPRILKVRTTNAGVTPAAYKWYAVVASGVNNYAVDGYQSTSDNPSLFLLDLSFKPLPSSGWVEGSNFWRIELPQTSTAIAKGLVGFNVVTNFNTSALETLYAGDLQGNVWKLDFSLNGVNSSNLSTTDATANLKKFNFKPGTINPFFLAKDSNGALQPITGEPVVANGLSGSKLVSLGTGKFLELTDTVVPLTIGASFYTLLDNGNRISDRTVSSTVLKPGSVDSSGNVTVLPFTYGFPTPTLPDLKMGWYIDFDKTLGERQVSDITMVPGKLFFGSLYPTKGACGEGGGRLYALNTLTGNGTSEESQVGILAAPLVIELGGLASTTPRETSGKRFGSQRYGVITQGSRGMQVAAGPPPNGYTGGQVAYSWLSWRQINNYLENKYTP